MPRTPEQVAADEALDAAVNQMREAYWPADNGVLLHYLVIGAERTYADDGSPCTPVFVHASGDGIPTYQSLGLLELAAHRMRRHDDSIELRSADDD